MRSVHAVVAIAWLSGVAAASPCPMIENKPVVLTPDGTAIDSGGGGGIVIATLPDYQRGSDRGAVADWHLGDGGRLVLVDIAPGLQVATTAGNATLVDKANQTLVHVAARSTKAGP